MHAPPFFRWLVCGPWGSSHLPRADDEGAAEEEVGQKVVDHIMPVMAVEWQKLYEGGTVKGMEPFKPTEL